MDALIKQGILFEIFLQFSLPPPIQCWNSDADVQRCLWGCWGGGGRGWVSVNWKKDSQFKCVSGLLSMIAVTGRLQFLSTFEMINRYPNPRVHLNCNLQLFRERLSEKVHAEILKGFVGCFEFTVLQKKKEIWNNGTRGYGAMLASA